MKRKALCMVLAMVMLIALFAAACAPAAEKEPMVEKEPIAEKEPIKIGFLTDLTGILSVNGIPARQGAIMAMEEIGYQLDGRPVELIIEDEASDPAIAVERARKLVETDKVCMIIGPFHGGCATAVADYISRVGIPQMFKYASVSNHAIKDTPWSWGTFGTMEQQTYATGAYAAEILGFKTATVMATDYEAGRAFVEGFRTAFEERGGKVIQEQWIPMGTADVASYILNLKEADILAPWFAGVTLPAGLRQIREFGAKMPVVMPQAQFMSNPKQIKAVGDDGVGIITADFYHWAIDNPKNKKFVEAYQSRWGELPAAPAYTAYATVQMALEALRKTGGDTSAEALAKALDETKYESIMGLIEFTDARVAISDYIIQKAIKVDGEYTAEILAKYRVRTDKVGDKLVHHVVSSEVYK